MDWLYLLCIIKIDKMSIKKQIGLFNQNVEKCFELESKRKDDDFFYKVVPSDNDLQIIFKIDMRKNNAFSIQYAMKDIFDETKIVKVIPVKSKNLALTDDFIFEDF